VGRLDVTRRSDRLGGIVHVIDDVTVGVVIGDDVNATALDELEQGLTAVPARCLVVDMSRGPTAPTELSRAVAGLIVRAHRRGFSVAVASPGPELVRALADAGVSRAVELVTTVEEALARVRGRLTPLPTIRVLDERQAA
jgi:hypothetical protein